jgi:hypothetical protein
MKTRRWKRFIAIGVCAGVLMAAMMKQMKIDIAEIEAADRGRGEEARGARG